MTTKLKHDAKDTIAGTIYQFYVAVDKCFDLCGGDKLIIEKYGDITISQKKQIEVKKYEDELTDMHENIWKTLYNWLQDKFDPSLYKELILLTTQDFSHNTLFRDWNEKDSMQKEKILITIGENYFQRNKRDNSKEALVKFVLNPQKRDKLKTVLSKYSILDSSPKETEYFENLKEKYGKGVLSTNRDDFINSLLGFIICNNTVNVNNWEISNDDFSARVEILTAQYSSNTKIFPSKYSNIRIDSNEMQEISQYLFVKKIEDINYHDVIRSAISDYVKTNKTIMEELKKYSVPKEHYDGYENELMDSFLPEYRKASRNATNESLIEMSKNFYDSITGSPVQDFINFNNTPRFFRNGLIHNLVDDETKNLMWKLKGTDNE